VGVARITTGNLRRLVAHIPARAARRAASRVRHVGVVDWPVRREAADASAVEHRVEHAERGLLDGHVDGLARDHKRAQSVLVGPAADGVDQPAAGEHAHDRAKRQRGHHDLPQRVG
jgi:hypothetical protein